MARKYPSAQLGSSLPEDDARALSSALKLTEGIDSLVVRVFVGERNDQPTDWWMVRVPSNHLARCESWRRAYEAGATFRCIDGYRVRNGLTFVEAADRLGYGPQLAAGKLAHPGVVAECCGCGRCHAHREVAS